MILGLCGYARVGKDEAAKHLENYTKVAFADVLKQEVTVMLGALGIHVDLWGEDKEEWRDFLVFWGAKRRLQNEDYWIKQVAMRIAAQPDRRVVITDVRYANEVAWIDRKKGLVVGIVRPGYGAANPEEGRTIVEIQNRFHNIPWLINDGNPMQLTAAVRAAISQFCANKRGSLYE